MRFAPPFPSPPSFDRILLGVGSICVLASFQPVSSTPIDQHVHAPVIPPNPLLRRAVACAPLPSDILPVAPSDEFGVRSPSARGAGPAAVGLTLTELWSYFHSPATETLLRHCARLGRLLTLHDQLQRLERLFPTANAVTVAPVPTSASTTLPIALPEFVLLDPGVELRADVSKGKGRGQGNSTESEVSANVSRAVGSASVRLWPLPSHPSRGIGRRSASDPDAGTWCIELRHPLLSRLGSFFPTTMSTFQSTSVPASAPASSKGVGVGAAIPSWHWDASQHSLYLVYVPLSMRPLTCATSALSHGVLYVFTSAHFCRRYGAVHASSIADAFRDVFRTSIVCTYALLFQVRDCARPYSCEVDREAGLTHTRLLLCVSSGPTPVLFPLLRPIPNL